MNYLLNVFGANGEPIPNTQVVLAYSVKGVEQKEKVTLKTDNQGQIHLGQLSIVNSLSAQSNTDRGRVDK